MAGHYAHLTRDVIKLLQQLVDFPYSLVMRHLLMTTLIAGLLFAETAPAAGDRANAREFARKGTAYAERGHQVEALAEYEKAISSDPDYEESYELALPLWLTTGQHARARQRLEHLTLRSPDSAFAWYALGAIYRREKRFDLAILAYEVYLGRRPDEPDGMFGLAMALVALNDERATDALERYVSVEKRPERRDYQIEALRLLRNRRSNTSMRSAELSALLRYLDVVRPWLRLVLGGSSGAADDASRESSPETRPE